MHDVFAHDHVIEAGHVTPSDAPGLGIRFNEEAARMHEFKRSYLGLNRLPDGTAWYY